MLIGSTLFFPAFVLSLPVTMIWAKHLYAGDAQGPLGGIGISFLFGIAIAVLGSIHRVRKVNCQLRDTKR